MHKFPLTILILIALFAGPAIAAELNTQAPPAPTVSENSSDTRTNNEAAHTVSEDKLTALKTAVTQFQNNRSTASWAPLAQVFKSYLSSCPKPANEDLKAAGLADLGLVCMQQSSLKLWYFPQAPDNGVYLQWPQSRPKPSAKSEEAEEHAAVQYLPLPGSTALKDARVLFLAAHPHDTVAQPGIKKKTKQPPATVHRLTTPSHPANKFLVLAGIQQPGGKLWLDCYQFSAGTWKENSAPLSKIPPLLIGNLTGDVSFVGNDLVLTASPSDIQATTGGGTVKGAKPDFSVYKLSMKLVDNYYMIDGQGHADTAHGAVTQFLQAAQRNRTDLAKAWVEDPSLANIPRYLKLFNQKPLSNFRIISLSAPHSIYRYRLITFGKDDLIFDVGHPKDQWIIKAIFVAPSDLGWQRIAENLPPLM
jgi:hypothetical protein